MHTHLLTHSHTLTHIITHTQTHSDKSYTHTNLHTFSPTPYHIKKKAKTAKFYFDATEGDFA